MSKLRWFVVEGEFEADDIDDALAFLAAHFAAIVSGEDDQDTRFCEFTVHPR